jgi:hypothetical protein
VNSWEGLQWKNWASEPAREAIKVTNEENLEGWRSVRIPSMRGMSLPVIEARGPKPMLTTNGGDCERTPEVEMILNKESKVADRALLLSGAG